MLRACLERLAVSQIGQTLFTELEAVLGSDALHTIVTRNLRDLQGAQLRFGALRVVSPEDFLNELLT